MSGHGIPMGLEVDDRIRFDPQAGRRWWTIRALDERYIVATCQAPFKPKGVLWYTVVDQHNLIERNDVVAGLPARSSLNTLGGGYDVGEDGELCDQIIEGLRSGEWELSARRIRQVDSIEVQR